MTIELAILILLSLFGIAFGLMFLCLLGELGRIRESFDIAINQFENFRQEQRRY